jgi:hypothetical protein
LNGILKRSIEMGLKERFQQSFKKSLDIGKDTFGKALHRARELGEKGVLTVEVRELREREEEFLRKIGEEVYQSIVVSERTSITNKNQKIMGFLEQITQVRLDILEREEELKKYQ